MDKNNKQKDDDDVSIEALSGRRRRTIKDVVGHTTIEPTKLKTGTSRPTKSNQINRTSDPTKPNEGTCKIHRTSEPTKPNEGTCKIHRTSDPTKSNEGTCACGDNIAKAKKHLDETYRLLEDATKALNASEPDDSELKVVGIRARIVFDRGDGHHIPLNNYRHLFVNSERLVRLGVFNKQGIARIMRYMAPRDDVYVVVTDGALKGVWRRDL